MAIRNAFHRAGVVIIDANVTHIMAATVLWVVGTEQVKGFAITFWLGAVLSMFSTMFVAKVIFEIAERRQWISKLKMLHVITDTSIDFMGWFPAAATFSVLITVLGLAVAFHRGQGLFDIDFTGGVSVEADFRDEHKPDDVRKRLAAVDLSDLAVSDVWGKPEEQGKRYLINTSEGDPETVKRKVDEVFTKELIRNTVEWGKLLAIAAPERSKAKVAEKPDKGTETPKEKEPRGEVEKSPGKTESKTDEKPAEKTDEKPTGKTEEKTEEKSAGKSDEKTVEKTGEKPADKTEEKTEEKPAGKSDEKTADKTEEKPAAKTDEKPADKTEEKTEEKPADKTDAKTVEKTDEKSAGKSDDKPDDNKKSEPPAKEQSRNDLPPHTMLALADSAPAPSAQDTNKTETPADKKSDDASKEKPEVKEDDNAQDKAAAKEEKSAAAKEGSAAKEKVTAKEEKTAAPKSKDDAKEKAAPKEKSGKKEDASAKDKAAKDETAKDKSAAKEKAAAKERVSGRFGGGIETKLTFSQKINHTAVSQMIEAALKENGIPEKTDFELTSADYSEGDPSPYDEWTLKIKLPPAKAGKVLATMQQQVAATPYFPVANTIGGAVATDTRWKAVYALVASWVLIILYLWIRFQGVAFGLAAVIALIHDVLVMLGAIAFSYYVPAWLGAPILLEPFKINLPIVAAFLTIIGYSVNDTIVVFDRVREVRGKSPRITRQMINDSTNQTLSRTLLTSFTVMLVVVILYLFGGQAVHGFAFALIVGVLTGTYSSIYVAAPILLWLVHPAEMKAGRDQ
jgi:SecD/SecF fusion protein